MKSKCKYKMPDGSNCNRSTIEDKTRCQFHSKVDPQKIWTGTDFSDIALFVSQTENGAADFSGIKFKDVEFKPSDTNSCRIRFCNSEFTNCSFKSLSFTDADFSGETKFSHTVFDRCTFWGTNAKFTSIIVSSKKPLFRNCGFFLAGDLITSVDFTGSYIENENSLFENCFVRATQFLFNSVKLSSNSPQAVFNVVIGPSHPDRTPRTPGIYLAEVKQISLMDLEFIGIFICRQLNMIKEFVSSLYLSGINFDSMTSSQFIGVNFTTTYFINSTISRVKFQNCIWNNPSRYKQLTEDSIDEQSDVKNTEELIRLYVQLKHNFESNGDYIGAGDWHYREMETRRRKMIQKSPVWTRPIKRVISPPSLYKFVSNYGESYKRPLQLLLILALLFSVVYFYSGYFIGDKYVNYNFCWGCKLQLPDFLRSIITSVSVMTFQIGRSIRLESDWSIAWSTLQVLLTVILVPLFLLAIRRKFRR